MTSFEYFLQVYDSTILSKEVISCAKENNNLKIIFMSEQEYETKNYLIKIEKKIIQLGIKPENVWIINNNLFLEKFKKELNLKINVYSIKAIANMTANLLKTHNLNFKEEKEKLFLFHNRSPKPHRYALLCLLKKYNLLENVDWSLMEGWKIGLQYEYSFFSEILQKNNIKNISKEYNYFKKIEQKKSSYEENFNWCQKDKFNGDWSNIYSKETYENAYVNITGESVFSKDAIIHITEKSFKPFYYYQFPLIVATPYHNTELKKLYNLEDVINHDFDNEENHMKRLTMIFEEIKRINKNKTSIINFYKKNKNRFIDNQNKIIAISTKTDDIDFFNNLIIL